jgi:hypothetical protein
MQTSASRTMSRNARRARKKSTPMIRTPKTAAMIGKDIRQFSVFSFQFLVFSLELKTKN